MKITINNNTTTIEPETSLKQLADSMQLPDAGIAIAINNKLIPKQNWQQTQLKETDQVVIVRAACGG